MAKGEPKNAITKLNRALALRPREAHLYHERALAYQEARDYSAAIQNMKKAMALNCPCSAAGVLEEQLAGLHVQFGEECYSRKEYEAALEGFSKASDIQPEHRSHTLKRCANPNSFFQCSRFAFFFNTSPTESRVCSTLRDTTSACCCWRKS